MAFSRVDRNWLIVLDDGTINYRLSSAVAEIVNKHMQAQHALNRRVGASAPSTSSSSLLRLLDVNDADHIASKQRLPSSNNLHRSFEQSPACLIAAGSILTKAIKKSNAFTLLTFQIACVDLTQHIGTLHGPPRGDSKLTAHYRSTLERRGHGSKGNERRLFYGTPRSCTLGDPSRSLSPCSRSSCTLCSILKTSFQVSQAGTAPGRNFLRFGYGIYTTSVSSK